MKSSLGIVWCLQVATWVSLLVTEPVQAVDVSDRELLQQGHSAHIKMVRDKVASGIAGRSLEKGAVESFTIHPYYDPSVDQLSPQQQRVLKVMLVNSAVEWLKSVLKTRPMATPIKFEQGCPDGYCLVGGVKYCNERCAQEIQCGPVTIPKNHLLPCQRCLRPGQHCEESPIAETSGISNAHFLLYVSALSQDHCTAVSMYAGTSLAKASHCLQEEEFDRPVAGYINVCPEAISTNPAQFSLQQSVVLHELLHALVFSQELFPYFHNEQGYPRSPRMADGGVARHPVSGLFSVDPNTVHLVHRSNWTTINPQQGHTVTMLVTPHVVREVRKHFNCSTLVGAELENQGGRGVAGVHWERRVFGEELMTGVLNPWPVLSRVTLALLHDSGWYLPDYRHGGQLSWGRGKGCVFVEESCGEWMRLASQGKEPLAPFCTEQYHKHEWTGCVNGRTAIGSCSIRTYTIPLPSEYQYLSRRQGGTLILADYCPLFEMWEYGEQRAGKSCLNPSHAPSSSQNLAAEVYGPGSRCFEQRELQKYGFMGPVGGVCYKFRCTKSRVLVEVGDQVIPCGREGRKKWFVYHYNGSTYNGSVVCPAYSDLCQAYDCINKCSDHGACHMGQCYCYHGYYGEDCSRTYAHRLLSCHNVTCQHNATCSERGQDRGFSCACPPGYAGALCERAVLPDPCENVSCHGNGYCTRTNGNRDSKCNCYRGYGGRQCRWTADLCADGGRPCLNSGTCVLNSTECVCPSEYWGEQCQYWVDLCRPLNLCPTGQLCTHHNATQSVSCACPHGYTGPNCTRLDHCAESPCANNGTCVNRLDGYECVCPWGYQGGRCRNQEHPCKRQPCGEGGRCQRVEGGSHAAFKCKCYPGYYGDLCEYT